MFKLSLHYLQNALIGMDIPMYENKRVASENNVFNIGSGDDIPFGDDYFEASNHFSSFVDRILFVFLFVLRSQVP